jgi:copper chaperone CopZ
MNSKTFVVPNISCGHCVHTVKSELGDLAGVKRVEADQATKAVTVEWDAPATWEQIESLLAEINYPPAGLLQIN